MLTLPAAAIAVALVLSQPQGDTLRLAEAQRTARAANPMLRAERLAALAARERAAPAGALADPQFEFGLENRMLKGFGTEDPMTMNTFRLSQMVPWPGKRTAARDGATALAEADSLGALEQEAMLSARVAMAYLEDALADRVLGVMGETLRLLRGFQETALGMYAVGQGIQQDVLQSHVAVARMAADTVARRAAKKVGREQRQADAMRRRQSACIIPFPRPRTHTRVA